jgi:guanyl-specific ribonuclease Sa
VPQNANDVLDYVNATGEAPDGYQGGGIFQNDGRAGTQVLPTTDASGNPITYTEYDVNPYSPGVNRGTDRLVTGSDGSAYYTGDHYETFTQIQ